MSHCFIYTTGSEQPFLVAWAADEAMAAVEAGNPDGFIAVPGADYLAEYDHDTDVEPFYVVNTDYIRRSQVAGICGVGARTRALIGRAQHASS